VTVLQHVLMCDVEREALLAELETLTHQDQTGWKKQAIGKHAARMAEVSERLEVIDSNYAETKARTILRGLGFSDEALQRPSSDFSGGWRMRLAIAKVIFCEPEILMLDEPTNHLDLPALIWLENYIQELDCTIIIISHARDFLNATVEEIIHFQSSKLTYYKGNFDQFEKTKNEKDRNQR